MSIEVRGVHKGFGNFVALNNVSFIVEEGELLALLGPSGCGKTTLLRIIAGLESADRGTVLFDGVDASQRSAKDRKVGFVFQHYALFKHMTVFENVAFGLRVRPRASRPTDAEIARKVHELLTLVQMDYLGDRYPSQLSGGQRQRVALARALAVEPKVLLLDEPFGALDAQVRQELRKWLRRLHAEIHLTSVFVTHDQEEALDLANRVIVMNKGVIEQEGTTADVVEHPATPFVLHFLGNVNRVQGGYVRPHELDITREETGGGFWATVRDIRGSGAIVRLEMLAEDGSELDAELAREQFETLKPTPSERVYVKARKLRTF